MIVGYAAGAFDLFHVGHLNILRQAKMRCDFLIAGVVSDERILESKGFLPVIPALERAEIVENISYVDQVFIETSGNRLDTWNAVKFDVFFKGDDWKGTEKGLELERMFASVGVRTEYFPYTVHTSSTRLRSALDAMTPKVPRALKA